MLATERHRKILSYLEAKGTARTVDLAEALQVTDETIRRDLQLLAESHLVGRVHGGATSLKGTVQLQSFTERSSIRVEQRRRLQLQQESRLNPSTHTLSTAALLLLKWSVACLT